MLNGYNLSKQWFDFAFENPRLVKPVHGILYLWCVEKNNRLGWVKEFQLPTDEGMQAVGVKDKETFLKALKDLATWGALKILQESKNIYSARYITLHDCFLSAEGSLTDAVYRTEKSDGITDAISDGLPDAIQDAIPTTIPQGTPTNSKRKTVKPKTNKLQTTNTSPPLIATGGEKELFTPCKNDFIKFYKTKFLTEYYFTAMDAAKLKSVLKKIVYKIKEKFAGQRESFDLPEVQKAFTWFYTQAHEHGGTWIVSNYSLKNLDTQFNELYTAIVNGKSKQPAASGTKQRGNGHASNEAIINALHKRTNGPGQ
jgi:hypothetical protein